MTTTLPCARGTPAFALFYRLRLLKAASGRRQHPPGLPRVTPGSHPTTRRADLSHLGYRRARHKGVRCDRIGRQHLLELMGRRLKQADRRGRADEKAIRTLSGSLASRCF